jgi:hypothetical protein
MTMFADIINPFFLIPNATVSGRACTLLGAVNNWGCDCMHASMMDDISSTHVVVCGHKVVESGEEQGPSFWNLADRLNCDLTSVTD